MVVVNRLILNGGSRWLDVIPPHRTGRLFLATDLLDLLVPVIALPIDGFLDCEQINIASDQFNFAGLVNRLDFGWTRGRLCCSNPGLRLFSIGGASWCFCSQACGGWLDGL